MIEFKGKASKACIQYLAKRLTKTKLIIFVPILALLAVNLGLWGYKSTMTILFYAVGILLNGFILVFPAKKMVEMSVSTLVTVNSNTITSKSLIGGISQPISKVKRVIDCGEWYHVILPLTANFGNYVVCQKQLVSDETKEEFEKLFKSKLTDKKQG